MKAQQNFFTNRNRGSPKSNFITKQKTLIMKSCIFLFLFLLFSLTTWSQLDKGNFLVGGSGKFYSYNSINSSSNYYVESKYTQIDLSPAVGYFVVDKLAFGLKPTVSSIKGKVTNVGGGSTNVQRYLIGPFGRYYFLDKDNKYNLLTDLSYQFGSFGGGLAKGNLATFSALAGPVLYFNTTVGIEFLFGYSYSKEDVQLANKEIRKGFQTSIGFQIHLEK